MSLDLTIAIPTRNEERNLPGCLRAIGSGFAREIVLLDSGSTDDTRNIAERFGVRVLEFHWNGRFPKKRNWYLREQPPTTRWVLFLDADEYISDAFKTEVANALPGTRHVGFYLHYSIYFLGRKLKGGYLLEKLALFRVGAGEYEAIEEDHWSSLDMEVHEHPILDGSLGRVHARIDHQDFRGVSHYVAKHNDYSSWEAARYLKLSADSRARASWSWKQRVKYALARTPLIAPIYFLGSYVFMGGWRDGLIGISFAILKSSYFVQIACKIKELETISKQSSQRTHR